MKNPEKGFKRIISAGVFSMQGLASAYKHEAAFRQEVWLTAILTPAALLVGQTWPERALLIGSLLFLLIVELLNSAVEAVVDRVGDEYHELAGRAKDMGSAAVLLTILLVGLTWLTVILS